MMVHPKMLARRLVETHGVRLAKRKVVRQLNRNALTWPETGRDKAKQCERYFYWSCVGYNVERYAGRVHA